MVNGKDACRTDDDGIQESRHLSSEVPDDSREVADDAEASFDRSSLDRLYNAPEGKLVAINLWFHLLLLLHMQMQQIPKIVSGDGFAHHRSGVMQSLFLHLHPH